MTQKVPEPPIVGKLVRVRDTFEGYLGGTLRLWVWILLAPCLVVLTFGLLIVALYLGQLILVDALNEPDPSCCPGTMSASSAAGGNETLDFGRFSGDWAPTEIYLEVSLNDQANGECHFLSTGDGPLECQDQWSPYTMVYADNGDNGLLNVGDSIAMGAPDGLASGRWVITMYLTDYDAHGNVIQFIK